MRKLALLLVMVIIITPPHILGQIGVTQFPKIGFGDYNLIARHPMYFGGTNNATLHGLYASSSIKYYFPKLQELGLTHLVTGADVPTTLNPGINPGIKIMDMNFGWDVTDNPGAYSAVYAFSHAEGNSDLSVPYQLGGDRTTNVNPDEDVSNYGFGTSSQSNFWMMQQGYPISDSIYNNSTGVNRDEFGTLCRSADKSLHDAGYLFWGLTNPLHQAVPWVGAINPSTYDFVLSMKISGSNYLGSDTVLIVKIKPDLNGTVEADPNSPNYIQNLQRDSVNRPLPSAPSDSLFVIRAQDVSATGFSPVVLRNIRPPISRNHGLQITAYWPKKVNVMIDHITYHNKFYDSLFLATQTVISQKELAISGSLNNYFIRKTADSVFYENLYEDEPTFMRMRALKKLNQLALNIDNTGVFHINGASGAYSEYYLRFSREFELDENSTDRFFKPYLLFTDYFMLVNRRCNMPGSTRYIEVQMKCPDTTFKQWKLTDLTENKDTIFTFSGNSFVIQHRYSPGTGKLFKLQPVLISGGVVTVNETVSKDITVEADVTISNNAKLTVQPGKTLKFTNNSKLIMISGGKLKAIGRTNSKITFDFVSKNWTAGNGIFNYNKSAVIKNALIKNASVGLYSYYSEGDTLDNVEITQCDFGLSLYNSYNNGYDKTFITNSIFSNITARGINMTASRPRILQCEITGNDIGLYCSNLSQPSLGEIEYYGNKKINGNNIGIYSTHSFPYLGLVGESDDSTLFGGQNELVNLEYNVLATNTSVVYAHRSWWGSEDPAQFKIELVNSTDRVETDYYLEKPPFNKLAFTSNVKGGNTVQSSTLNKSIPELEATGNSLTSIDHSVKKIFKLLKAKNIKGAFNFCSGIISDNPDSIKILPLTVLLSRIASMENSESFPEFINTLNTGSQHRLKNFSKLLTLPYDPEKKMVVLNKLLSSENDSIIELSALHLLALEKLYSFQDKAGSRLVLQKMKTKYPVNSLTQDLEVRLSDTLQIKGMSKPGGNSIAKNSNTFPSEYKLIGNYPNPFNPETKIVFSLKERSSVQVTVYDILGREIFTDKLGELNAGSGEHGININSKNLSSGVYLYRFEAESIETEGLKFSKVSKFIVLK